MAKALVYFLFQSTLQLMTCKRNFLTSSILFILFVVCFNTISVLITAPRKIVTINLSFSFADTILTMEKGGRKTRSDIRMRSILLRSSWRILSGFVKTVLLLLLQMLNIRSLVFVLIN